MDKLDNMAQDPRYHNVQFVSICCDKLDGARSIIERDQELRWQNVSHYFMDSFHKEQAKKILGFKTVPFYVVVDSFGDIQQLGSDKVVDFDDIPGVARLTPPSSPDSSCSGETNEDCLDDQPMPIQVERVFNMDDLDF